METRPAQVNRLSRCYDALELEDQAKVSNELIEFLKDICHPDSTYQDANGNERKVGVRTRMRAIEMYNKLLLERLQASVEYERGGKVSIVDRRNLSVSVSGSAGLEQERERALKESRHGKALQAGEGGDQQAAGGGEAPSGS